MRHKHRILIKRCSNLGATIKCLCVCFVPPKCAGFSVKAASISISELHAVQASPLTQAGALAGDHNLVALDLRSAPVRACLRAPQARTACSQLAISLIKRCCDLESPECHESTATAAVQSCNAGSTGFCIVGYFTAAGSLHSACAADLDDRGDAALLLLLAWRLPVLKVGQRTRVVTRQSVSQTCVSAGVRVLQREC